MSELNINTEVIVHMDGKRSKVFDDMESAHRYIDYEKQVELIIEGFRNKWGSLEAHKVTFCDIAQYLVLNGVKVEEMSPQDEMEEFNYTFFELENQQEREG